MTTAAGLSETKEGFIMRSKKKGTVFLWDELGPIERSGSLQVSRWASRLLARTSREQSSFYAARKEKGRGPFVEDRGERLKSQERKSSGGAVIMAKGPCALDCGSNDGLAINIKRLKRYKRKLLSPTELSQRTRPKGAFAGQKGLKIVSNTIGRFS